MKSMLILIGLGLTVLICFALPIGGLFQLKKTHPFMVRAWITGVLTFFISQILLRLPLIQIVLPKQNGFIHLQLSPVLYALFLGLTAGLFEETGRFIVFRFFIKQRTQAVGIAFGLGHGGIEAFLLVGINMAFYLFCYVVNLFFSTEMLENVLGSTLALKMLPLLQSFTPLSVGISGLERLSAMCLHICFSLLILYGLKITYESKRPLARYSALSFYLLALILHTLVDTSAVLYKTWGLHTSHFEGILFAMAFALLFGTLKLTKEQTAI